MQDRRVVFERHLSSSIEADVDAVDTFASRGLLLLMLETSGGEKETESVGLHVDEGCRWGGARQEENALWIASFELSGGSCCATKACPAEN